MRDNVSRRDFLKFGGFAGAGIAAVGLGVNSLVGCSSTKVITESDFVYTCPLCGKNFIDYDSLRQHFEQNHPEAAIPQCATLTINGTEVKVQVEPHWTLRETLLRAVGLTGAAKEMCDRGGCGSCTVLMDGVPALACTLLAVECEGHQIETSEGIAADPTYRPLVEAYAKHDAAQCGYCTPGQLTVAKYNLNKYDEPTEEEIRTELSGNICRCGTYSRHVLAIQEAAAAIKGGN